MFKNYLKIAVRNLMKHKSFSFINISGLAIGLVSFFLIILYVQHELSYDRFHKNAPQIYRILQLEPAWVQKEEAFIAVSQTPLARTLEAEIPEVRHAVRIRREHNSLFTIGNRSFHEEGLLWADANLFTVFTFPLNKGDPEIALAEPYSVVLSEKIARKYFGDADPIGQTVQLNEMHDLKVTGVMQNVPSNSHLRFEMVASIETFQATNPQSAWLFSSWGANAFFTYILLPDGVDLLHLEEKLTALVNHKVDAFYQARNWDRREKTRVVLQPLPDIHLYASDILWDMEERSDIGYIYIFTTVALIILLIACTNYMNLATARASLRAKEVGMRKVIGANRRQLISQYMGESLLMAAIATGLAFDLALLALPTYSELIGVPLQLASFSSWQIVAGLFGLLLITGLLSGSYPALVLSRFQPVKILKGGQRLRNKPILRNTLVVVQFGLSIAFIIGTLAIQKQITFIKNKKLGFNREHVVVLHARDPKVQEKYAVIKQKLLQHSEILGVTSSDDLPINIHSMMDPNWQGKQEGEELASYFSGVNHDFLEVFDMQIVSGRSFSPARDGLETDTVRAYIINEELQRTLGWETPIGKSFSRGHSPGQVVGVIKNVHTQSLREKIKPLFLYFDSHAAQYISIRIRPENIAATLSYMREVWNALPTKHPFEYFFLDERFDQMYKTETNLSRISGYFTFLAIFISAMGLFGLASFTAEQRTKEVGIRKVLGASIASVTGLLSREFVKLVLLANLIAWPVAWYAMNRWLENFAYRIEIGWWIFALAGGLALLIALLTVSAQAVKAALANPVESLRYE